MNYSDIQKYMEMVYDEVSLEELSYYKRWKGLNKKSFYDRYHNKIQYILTENLCGKKVLDCGCGVGTETILMGLMGARVLGVDVNKKRLEEGRKRLLKYQSVFEFNEMPELRTQTFFNVKDTFDYLLFNESFHHIEPRAEFFFHLDLITKPLSKIMFLETNGRNPLLRMMFFLKRGSCKCSEKHGVSYGMENVVSVNKLVKNMTKWGFIRVKHGFHNVVPTTIQNMSNSIHMIDKTLCNCPGIRSVFSSSYIALFQKKKPNC
jgi:2-polyprenyl-3-methyl-5-hydroxy-6-metoxy-1,4-benzoquinol methylase